MRNYYKCGICGTYHWTDGNCPPVYEVNYPEYMGEDEWHEVRASSFESAAEKYGRYYNQDFELMNETIEVQVRYKDEIQYFKVSAEPDIHYATQSIEKFTEE